MPVFFNGREWISPASMSAIDDSAMYDQNLAVGNVLAVMGLSTGGQPNTPLSFSNPSDARNTLLSGELLTAVEKAFSPSNETGGPAKVVAIRIAPAVQGVLMLLDSTNNPVIDLKARDWGLYTNQIKSKIEAGSTSGLKLTVQYGTSYYSQDNVSRSAFTVQYTGALATQPSATMTVSNATVTLSAPAGTVVATIDLNTYPTVQQLVDRINAVAGFSATVSGNGALAALNALDSVNAQDVRISPYVATANLQAVVDWFNGNAQNLVTATRQANAGAVPAVMPFTYLAGGSDGTSTTTDWSNAFTTLQNVDCQAVAVISGSSAIWAMADSHVQFMSTTGRKERRAFCGEPLATADSQAMTDAKGLNSDRTALAHIGYYDYDANGNLTLFAPYMTAALVGAMFAGSNPGTPMTNKTLAVQGLERNLRNPTDTDALIEAGVLCVENTPQGYKVVKSISTWLADSRYDRVEISVGYATDYTARSVRDALDVLRGQKATPLLLSRAVSITQSTLQQLSIPEPNGPGVLVGDDKNPPFKSIQASLNGDVVAVSYQASPVLPANYLPQTVHIVPYIGTATA